MAFNLKDILNKIVIAAVFFFVGCGVMFLKLANRLAGEKEEVKARVRQSVKRRVG